MRNSTLRKVLLFSGLTILTLQACRKDDAAMMTPPSIASESFVEEFDSIEAAYDRGWRFINVSDPLGDGPWVQGMLSDPLQTGLPTPIPFNAHSSRGTNIGFIGCYYYSTSAAAGIISNWAISPVVSMQNGDKIQFYTRAVLYSLGGGDSTDWVNRLQVRANFNNTSLNVGDGLDPGDFTTPLLDINPQYREALISAYDPQAYPIRWTKFEAIIGGLNGPTKGRFAFRYFVQGGGSNGLGSGVGIDSVAYIGRK